MEDNIDYFGTKDYRIQLSQCDIDMLRFALNHIDWTYYDSDDFCGESADAAGIHFDDILTQLGTDTEWE